MTYDPMELTPLIPLRSPQMILTLPRTKLSEILSCFGHYIGEEFEFYTA
jgi:hypothetical protein